MATRKSGETEANTSGNKGTGSTAKQGAAAKKSAPAKAAGAGKSGASSGGGVKSTGGGRSTAKKSATADTGDGGGRPAANVTPKKAAGAGGAAKKGAAAAKSPAKKSAGGGKQGDMRPHLREFASSRMGGWSHDDWEGLLGDLQQRGFDVSDRDAVGMSLERERLSMMLERVPGVSGAKAKSLTERFGRLWDLRNASTDEIAEAAKLPRDVAERIQQSVH